MKPAVSFRSVISRASLALALLPACSDGHTVLDAPTPSGKTWVVGGWISTADEYTGHLTVLDDISSSGNIDLTQVVEFGGDMMYASPGGGLVFVGLEGDGAGQGHALRHHGGSGLQRWPIL